MTTHTEGAPERDDPYVLSPQQADDLLRGFPWRRFAVLGDSMAEGILEASPGYRKASWADRVHGALLRGNPDLAYLNTGYRGVVSAQVLADQLPKALEFEPDLAAVLCGGNDFLAPEFRVEAYQENLDAIVGALTGAGATVFLYSLIDITSAFSRLAVMRPRMAQLNAATLEVARKYGAVWVPCWEHPAAGDRSVYSSDMLHMSARGHAIIASLTVEALGRHLGNAAAADDPAVPAAAAPAPAAGAGDDTGEQSISGVYDYFLGGAEYSEHERVVAERALAAVPGIKIMIWENRKFLKRLVRYAVAQGITQILDLGSGIPARGSVHALAHAVDPQVRVVYVDNDPVAVARGRELLADVPHSTAVQADLTRPEELFARPEVRELLDFDRPIAVLFLGVLHFIPTEELEPALRVYREALAPGSLLALSHTASGEDADSQAAYRVYAEAFGFATKRTKEELTAFLGDFELVEPGVVQVPDWRPDPSPLSSRFAEQIGSVHYLGAVATKRPPSNIGAS
ncbi:SAM-dependent methyltransferase [Kitasatospora sp. NPDC097643]|uniref:SAM-dependent methyltransferase n=1 Tax=Kitasatospora sp. NPDC097643 TaxID=3157230 RepID=UPI00332A85A5